jgi:transglutaminase-like putative cysteine protease
MRYRIIHRTEYEYSDLASVCHNIAHISPRPDAGQDCSSHFLSVVPQPSVIDEMTDHFGNRLYYFSIEKPHRNMVVTATSIVEVKNKNHNSVTSSSKWTEFDSDSEKLPATIRMNAVEFMMESFMIPHMSELKEYARSSFDQFPEIIKVAGDLMKRIFTDFKYDPTFTTLATPLRDVITHKRGVCQDFAHLAIGCLRSFGIPARYVSGYLETFAPEGKEKLVGADASHAWVSVFTPDAGWIDLDPTNNQHPDDRYITIGWGRDYSDVPPLKGVIFGGGTPKMKVSVDVEPFR